MWTRILKRIGIVYDADRDCAPPIEFVFEERVQEVKRETKQKTPEEDNAEYIRGQRWVKETLTETDNIHIEFKREDVVRQERTADITAADRRIAKERNLNLDKYARFKSIWSEQVGNFEGSPIYRTNKQIAEEATKRYGGGYKDRTADEYCSAINAVNSPSPAVR